MMTSILVIAGITFLTRAAPFVLFRKSNQVINFLGNVYPPAIMGMLVIYSLKDIQFNVAPYGLYEFISVVIVVIIHLWRRNILESIIIGTLIYMFFIQVL